MGGRTEECSCPCSFLLFVVDRSMLRVLHSRIAPFLECRTRFIGDGGRDTGVSRYVPKRFLAEMGIDIESSRNVLIEYCTLSCGDDCFTLKAGRCEDGLRVNRPTENICHSAIVWHKKGHGAITLR